MSKNQYKELILGVKIKQLRLEKGFSLQELGQKTGMAISYLNEIEKGKKYPRPEKMKDLAQALSISVEQLTHPELDEKLKPIEKLIHSKVLTEMPLEIFGLAKISIVSLFTDKPSKASAFIQTLLELARNFDLSTEKFYMAILRSYQEIYQNYFENLEQSTVDFKQKYAFFLQEGITFQALQKLLQEEYHYQIQTIELQKYPNLHQLRTIMMPKIKPNHKNTLLLHPQLNETQKVFALAREIGYNFLQLKERVYTSTWTKVETFEELFHNYQASYFAGALLISENDLQKDLQTFFQEKTWCETAFRAIMQRYKASPEMFLHRLISISTHFFNIKKLFFLRFTHQKNTQEFILDKELHLSNLHNPHAINLKEHYCRRWISINILKDLEQIQQKEQTNAILCKAQISKYYDSANEYLCISIARNLPNSPEINTSVTIGFLITPELKNTIHFLEDNSILTRQVGVSCERCSAIKCQERVGEPTYLHQKMQINAINTALEKLQKDYAKA